MNIPVLQNKTFFKTGFKNYDKYWKNWNVLQTPKINFEKLKEEKWEVMDVNIGAPQTVSRRGDIILRVTYLELGGVQRIEVRVGKEVKYDQFFNFVLKPNINELEKIIKYLFSDTNLHSKKNIQQYIICI